MTRIKLSSKELKNTLKIAEERIKSAEILLQKGLFRDSISRSYYAIYDIVSALLATKGRVAKTHSGLISSFGKYYIKTDLIPKKFGLWLTRLAEKRQKADYERFAKFSKKEAEIALNIGKDFFKKIKEILPLK